ncbi:VOC family protein [Pseudalkalibacillus hwajinpoensis]|uniref:Glyoxalase n=1 Tax=Guptibacillus hwajinpoensis TaxID=208199 RepID=A0A4U1MLP5_9BACL|nr:VOC family protein [Pseudalkalibacillus hwajinpoensis]TKD71837.1 glyoxalase [Pseudalkalibacillus hwajinpoensis]
MSIQYKRLHHIQICIPPQQEDIARDFYLNTLGFQEINKPEQLRNNGGFWLKVANIEVHIGVEKMGVPGKRHPAFEVVDIEEARKHLVKNNVPIQEDTQIDGYERFSFFDPFQNRIEFLSRTI